MATGLTGDTIHPGSWFSLPDLGFTETLATAISGGKNQPNTYDLSQAITGQQPKATDITSTDWSQYKSTPTTTDSTNQNNNVVTKPDTGGTYNFNMADFGNYAGWDPNAAYQDWLAKGKPSPGGSGGGSSINDQENAVRNQLSSAWDSYFRSLDDQYNGLDTQAGNMNQIVDNNYNQSVSDINAEKTSNLADLATSSRKNEENQVKSLADIADNIRNLFRSGNIYLGARGAGDSSAANQYSYATAKLGSKQRGSVLEQTRSIENDIEDRRAKLNNLVTQEMGRIKTERDNNVLQTAQWLAEAQNTLRQARANGELQKGQSLAQLSQNLLDEAKSRLMAEDTRAKNRQDALTTWAMNNATSINQLKSNLAAVGQMTVNNPTYSKLSGSPTIDAQGNLNTNFYGGAGSTTEDKNALQTYLGNLWINQK